MGKLRRLSAPASLAANLSTDREMQFSQFGAPSMREVLASQFLPISNLASGQQGTAVGDNTTSNSSSPMDHQYPQSAPASPVSSNQFAPILSSAASTPDVRSSFTAVLPFASASAGAVAADNATAALASLVPG